MYSFFLSWRLTGQIFITKIVFSDRATSLPSGMLADITLEFGGATVHVQWLKLQEPVTRSFSSASCASDVFRPFSLAENTVTGTVYRDVLVGILMPTLDRIIS